MPPYRVAVIGRTGRGDYGHGLDRVWNDLGGAELVAVADDDDGGRRQAAARLGARRAYADYREMLARERPEFVSVAPRWADAHRDMILACAEAGAHVFTEKPLCRTLEEADAIVAGCEKAGTRVAIAHPLRHAPEVAAARGFLDAGGIGEVLELRGSGKEDARGGGEDLLLLGSHVLDLCRLLLGGEPGSCFARIFAGGRPAAPADARPGGEGIGPILGDRIDALYDGFPRAVPAWFTTTRDAGAGARFGLRILGTGGAMAIEPGSPEKVFVTDDPKWGRGGGAWRPLPVEPDDAVKRLPGAHWIQQANLRAVADLIRAAESGTQPAASLYDGRATLEMVLAVYASWRAGAPVKLPLAERTHPLLHFG